jgi:hypothetical protein
MKKKVLITILTSPLTSKKTLQYLIKNINNGLNHNSYDCDVTLEFITWWATKLEDDVLGGEVSDLDETNPMEFKKFKEFLNTEVLSELNKQIDDNKKIFDDIHNTCYKSINNIICNHSFQEQRNFKGYGAVHQFELLTDHIRRSVNYDSYIFISSNILLYNKAFIQGYLEQLEIYKVPFITHVPNIEMDSGFMTDEDNDGVAVDQNKFVKLKHGNLNTFACKPTELIDFLDNKINKVFDSNKYLQNGMQITLGTEFAKWDGICIKNYKHSISNDYIISKNDLLDTTIFPFDNSSWEPAIQFPLFLLLYCIRYPDVYDTPLIWSDSLSIKVPEYSIDQNNMDIYNASLLESERYEPFWGPYLNQEIVFDIIGNLSEKLKIKKAFSVSKQIEKTCDTLINYLDVITYNDGRKQIYHYNYHPIRPENINKTLLGVTFSEQHATSSKAFSYLLLKYFR